jgi:hypothetical protein
MLTQSTPQLSRSPACQLVPPAVWRIARVRIWLSAAVSGRRASAQLRHRDSITIRKLPFRSAPMHAAANTGEQHDHPAQP